jgi:hypothetical protein
MGEKLIFPNEKKSLKKTQQFQRHGVISHLKNTFLKESHINTNHSGGCFCKINIILTPVFRYSYSP